MAHFLPIKALHNFSDLMDTIVNYVKNHETIRSQASWQEDIYNKKLPSTPTIITLGLSRVQRH